MHFPCYIINLNGSEQNFEKQKPYLIEEGLNPIRFRGIDARKDEHIAYKDRVTKKCQLTCPKSVIGCGLSHILLAQHLKDIGVPLALVLEDDAFPKVCNLLEQIQKTMNEVPEDWDMIKFHCGSFGRQKHADTGASTAAYMLNSSGIQKLSNLKLNFHIDNQLKFGPSDLIVYKSKDNLFWADESFSSNRGTSSKWLNIKVGDGEQVLSQVISYKIFRIPGTSIEVSWLHVIIILLFGSLYFFFI